VDRVKVSPAHSQASEAEISGNETYWNSRRRELESWLARYSPDLVDLYRGALQILFQPEFPGRLRFVSHAVREIRNRVPDLITGTKPKHVEYRNICDGILKQWTRAALPLDGTVPASVPTANASTASVGIPKQIYVQIARLMKEHFDGRETNKQRAKRMYQALIPEGALTPEAPTRFYKPGLQRLIGPSSVCTFPLSPHPPRSETRRKKCWPQFEKKSRLFWQRSSCSLGLNYSKKRLEL
jgi:hypothetical protein